MVTDCHSCSREPRLLTLLTWVDYRAQSDEAHEISCQGAWDWDGGCKSHRFQSQRFGKKARLCFGIPVPAFLCLSLSLYLPPVSLHLSLIAAILLTEIMRMHATNGQYFQDCNLSFIWSYQESGGCVHPDTLRPGSISGKNDDHDFWPCCGLAWTKWPADCCMSGRCCLGTGAYDHILLPNTHIDLDFDLQNMWTWGDLSSFTSEHIWLWSNIPTQFWPRSVKLATSLNEFITGPYPPTSQYKLRPQFYLHARLKGLWSIKW